MAILYLKITKAFLSNVQKNMVWLDYKCNSALYHQDSEMLIFVKIREMTINKDKGTSENCYKLFQRLEKHLTENYVLGALPVWPGPSISFAQIYAVFQKQNRF